MEKTSAAASAGSTAEELKTELRRLVRSIEDDTSTAETFKEAARVLEALKGLQIRHRNDDGDASDPVLKRSSPLSPAKPPQPPDKIDRTAEIPDQFICPISSELLKDPVVLITGETYDRRIIESLFNSGIRTCPRNQQIISDLSLTPNNLLRRMIFAWCADHSITNAVVDDGFVTREDRDRLTWLLNMISNGAPAEAIKELRKLTRMHSAHRAMLGENSAAILKLISVPIDGPEGREDTVTTILNLSIHDSNKKTVAEILGIIPFHNALFLDALFLNINHISALIDLAKDTVPAIRSPPWPVEATLNLSNVCLGVMGAPQLGTAIRFLKALKTCRSGSIFEEAQDEEMPLSSQISVFLVESEVTVQLKNGTWPDDVLRWLYDFSAEVSSSSMNNAVKSREHNIRKVVKKYLQFLVRLARACQLKKRRWEHPNAWVNLRYLDKDDLRERIRTYDGVEKIAMGEIIQGMCALEESNQENHHIQDVISKKINKLRFECLLIDARIMWVLGYLGKLRPKIGRASKLDYSIVVKSLVRYCFKKRMENLLKQITRDLSVSELEAHKNDPSNQLEFYIENDLKDVGGTFKVVHEYEGEEASPRERCFPSLSCCK